MVNPFLNKSEVPGGAEYITPVSSVNRIRLAKLPVYGVCDEIEGLTVKEFFSVKLVIEAVKKNADRLHIDLGSVHEKKLPRVLAEKADDTEDESGSELAVEIITHFGSCLGLLLLALRLGECENREARCDWTDAHWEYWKQIEDIILVGGLASGTFGRILKERIEYVFSLKEEKPYNILLYANSSQVAILGCASCIKADNGTFVVLDFGQTGIKRSFVTKCDGEISDIKELESYPSKYMDWEIPDEQERLRQAKELHSYLCSVIEQTYAEAKRAAKSEPSGEIMISIASYTINGALNESRSGYAKLCALGGNYAEILSYELSGRLRRSVEVTLIHDGTAVAMNFRNRKNTVCLTVGSYFGVGFPGQAPGGSSDLAF